MKTTKKIICSFIALLFIAGTSFAQKGKKDKEVEKDPNKYKKLATLYDKGKYADCTDAAEKWMENEKYNKDPDIYMYASMSYLAIYKDPDSWPLKKYPDFKNSLKQSMIAFGKFRKHDKTGEMAADNKDFVNDLKGIVIQQALDLREKKDNPHLITTARDIVKYFDKDDVMMLFGGSYLLMTNNLADGLRPTDSAMVSLKKKVSEKPTYTSDEQKALNEGFIVYTDYLLSKKETGKAIDAISIANELLIPNDKLKTQSEKILKASPGK